LQFSPRKESLETEPNPPTHETIYAMTEAKVRVLASVVDRYDTEDGAVHPAEIATAVDADIERVRSCFDHLEAYHLIVQVEDGGYRPTITGREFLDLDPEDSSILVLDAEPDR
jgi:predicted transcriptional regulator